MVSGENLIDAQPTFQQNEPVVSFRFDAAGGKRFGDATSQNVGKHLAIVLDDQVISAPQIREPILGGSGVITGGFTVAEAQDLALLLRAGALPAPLTVLEERTVGPGLGADSIEAGKTASIVGVILVVAFMVVCYGLFGVFADVGLIVARRSDLGGDVGPRRDPDASRHRRHRPDDRHGRRCQRADLRTHPRGGSCRTNAGLGDRRRLHPGDDDDLSTPT